MTTASSRAILALLDRGGAFRLARRLVRRRLVVLTYHHVLPRPAGSVPGRPALPDALRPANVLYTDEFARQLDYLHDHAHVLTASELRAAMRGAPLPPRAVVITFDDGYRNNYQHAFPLLAARRLTAVFFVTSGFVGDRRRRLWFDRLDAALAAAPARVMTWLQSQPGFASLSMPEFRERMKRTPPKQRDALVARVERVADCRPPVDEAVEPMTWSEVREMAAAGMVIGGHTATHQILASTGPDDAAHELVSSRAAIEQHTDSECWCFSYPNGEAGDFRDFDKSLVAASGFECAFTQQPGFVDAGTDRFALPRVPVPGTGDFRAFVARASGLWPLLAISTNEFRRWTRAS